MPPADSVVTRAICKYTLFTRFVKPLNLTSLRALCAKPGAVDNNDKKRVLRLDAHGPKMLQKRASSSAELRPEFDRPQECVELLASLAI